MKFYINITVEEITGHYLVSWWDNGKTSKSAFNTRKEAVDFAVTLFAKVKR